MRRSPAEMGGASLDDRLPRLATQLDASARDFIHKAAMAGQTVRVPLAKEPPEGELHELEVHTTGFAAPLVLLAVRVGPRAPTGFPLRLGIPQSSLRDRRVGRELAGGKLVIEARVGQGGVGTVYRARHRDLRMNVAVKVLHEGFASAPDFVARFHAEALSASRLDHPNLTRVFDFGQEEDGLLYLAMEYLDGRSLRDLLSEYQQLSFLRAAQLMIQVCTGLTHAHARDVVHRDIKPENLVLVNGLDDDGNAMQVVKVCDFGIAHRAAADAGDSVTAGTPEYMAPEQFDGEDPDAQSDVYACGVVLYELLTGEVPITGSVEEIVEQQKTMRFDRPAVRVPGLDSAMDHTVMRAIAKDKAVRYASVRDLRADLRACIGESNTSITGPPPRVSPSARPSKPPTQPPPLTRTSAPPAQPQAQAETPNWFETGTDYLYASMIPTMPPTVAPPAMPGGGAGRSPSIRPPSMHPSMPVDVPAAIEPLIRKIRETKDPKQFAALVEPLTAKIRAAVEQGDPATLWHLRAAFEMVAAEPAGFGGYSRAESAKPLLALFSDANTLGVIAEKSLHPIDDRGGTASYVIVRGGKGAAHALYRARLKNADFEARQRFVANLVHIGGAALPIIRAALEKLESQLGTEGAPEVCQDLLLALPGTLDEGMRAIVARYAECGVASVATLAGSLLRPGSR